MPPLTVKKLPKIGKKSGKEEKSGIKGKNQDGSFTLPLLTDRTGYATVQGNRIKSPHSPVAKSAICLYNRSTLLYNRSTLSRVNIDSFPYHMFHHQHCNATIRKVLKLVLCEYCVCRNFRKNFCEFHKRT